MLYTSHNMQDIESICKRVVFIHAGCKLVEGTTQEIMEQFQQQSLEEVFIHIARSGKVKEEE